jgi:serine/threonine protein kinase
MDDDRERDREERLDQVIADLLDEAEAAEALDRRRWLVRYPEFFDELSDFFADCDAIEAIAAPLRDIARAADEEWSFDWLAPPDHPENLGRLGEYEVIDRLGKGGMGVVFKGFDAGLNRYVAIKVLAPQWSSDAGARRRFTREAQAAAAVSHPHVITIHAVGEWQGRPYLVMEYVSGASLQQRIEEAGPLELRELLRIGAQAASGLAAAHAQGLIHRDIKPGNIMLENELARVKITDFGLARAVDDTRLTQHGALAGTPPYMAPEQGRGDRLDRRADLFSLGSVLYAMATGRAAFRGDSTFEVLTAEKPTTGGGVGPELYVRTVDGWSNYISMYRWVTQDENKPILGVSAARKAEGKPFFNHRKNAMTAKAGRFRIVRVGPVVHYLVAEGTSDTFRELQQAEFVTKDFDLVRFMGQVNNAPSALDVLLKDLTIRAEGLPGWTGGVPQPKRFPWRVVVAAVAGVVALGVGLWWPAARKAREVE